MDWRYEPFTSLASWRTARVDDTLWTRTLDRLRAAQGAQSESARREEVEGSLRAAALNTGAIEGLHHADRGLTVTVVNDAAWQVAVERAEGPAARSFMEAALEAFDLVFDVATNDRPLSEALIRRVHEVVTAPQLTYVAHTAIGRQDVPLPRGTYKTLPNHVIEPDGTPHAYAPPDTVPTEMHRLVTELSADDGTTHPIVMAAFAHHAFVAVHPFADGNGRVARLLASISTMRAASVPLMIWSDQSVEYRAALKRADDGDPQPFVDFVFDRTIDAISLMTDRLRARSAETALGDEATRALAEEAQIAAAARLWSTVERELLGVAAERPGQLAADTQEVTFEFEGRRTIVWQGQSCNGFMPNGKGRGSTIHGTDGTVFVDRNGYAIYDLKNKVVKESYGDETASPLEPKAPDRLTGLHITNFISAVRTGSPLNAPIAEGHKSVLLCHIANIAQRLGRPVVTDPANGQPAGGDDVRALWSREYAPGWLPAV